MPARRITACRDGGVCRTEFAHDITIRPGDRTLVTTYFASDEACQWFGVPPLAQTRVCLTCTASAIREAARIGTLDHIKGLRFEDITAAGV